MKKLNLMITALIVLSLILVSGCTEKNGLNDDTAQDLNLTGGILGYIIDFDTANESFVFNPVEWVTLDDTDRIAELGLDADQDMPNGFYIYDENGGAELKVVNGDTKYNIIDMSDMSLKDTTIDQFIERMSLYDTPYWVIEENGIVTGISEQYLP